ncbi:MAG: aminoacyl-tRNA hydrolase [candidate division Zixibacteria bacterium RBG_16_53_22]|nr:MAG: aminoacyl-tRNA hydrolase [candidate division Zixibacteria bacterium RBG_16_53_22]
MEDNLQPRFKAIIGLGNPGRDYEATRHNLGFMVADTLAGGRKFKAGKGDFYSREIELSSPRGSRSRKTSARVVLLKPTTYMNRSGLAVAQFAAQNNISPSELLVIADDFYLQFGQLRIRKSGSDGGHKGLASIIYHLGSEEFSRLRLGIGPVPECMAAEEFVLRPFAADEADRAGEMVKRAVEAVETWFDDGFEIAAARFNRVMDDN